MKLRFSTFVSGSCLAFALTASQSAAASEFDLTYQGLTNASSINGSQIASGTSYEIQIGFDSSSEQIVAQGEAEYLPTSISLEIGGTPYTVTTLSGDAIGMADASNPTITGINFPFFDSSLGNTQFSPGYAGTTTAGWSATDVTPTVFTGYLGSLENTLSFPTTDGVLVLDYSSAVGIDASITAVPEGGTFTFLLLGMAALGLCATIRRPGIAADCRG